MVRSMERKPGFAVLLGISSYQLGLSAVRLFFSSILLPLQIESVVPAAQKGQALGLIVGISVGFGIVVNFYGGIVSDRGKSKLGKRSQFIFLGTLLTIPFLLLFLFFPTSIWMIFISFFGIQFFTSLALGSYQPLLPDIVPEKEWDREASLQVLLALIGSALAFLAARFLSDMANLKPILILLAILLAVSTFFTLLAIRPFDRSPSPKSAIPGKQVIPPASGSNQLTKNYFWLIFAVFFIYMGMLGIQYFGIYYFEGVLHLPDPVRAMSLTGMINLAFTMVAALLAIRISKFFGRRNLLILVISAAALINLAFPFMRSLNGFILVMLPYTIMLGLFSPVCMALTSELVPKKSTGKYLAFSNLAFGLPNALSPLIGGFILSISGKAPGVNEFIAFYLVSSLFYLAGILFMIKVPNSSHVVATSAEPT
jgi:MFS family permease